MSPRERELESQLRQARSQVLDLRVQSIEMEKVKAASYEAYTSTMAVMGQRYGLE